MLDRNNAKFTCANILWFTAYEMNNFIVNNKIFYEYIHQPIRILLQLLCIMH